MSHDKQQTRGDLERLQREQEILQRDKSYLSKQNSQLQDKVQRLEDRNDRLETEIVEAKDAAQKYLNRLLDSKTSSTSDIEKKFEPELNQLRDRHAKELELVRSNLADVHQERIEALREAKERSDGDLTKTQQDLKCKTEAYEELLLDHRTLQNKFDSTIQDLRSELRIKADAFERTQNAYEDTLTTLRHSKAENTMLRDKVDVLQQEVYKVGSRASQENAELRAQYAVAKENLQQYALIEQELDQAIKDQDVTGFQAPTTAKRRVQQSLELAKQLKQKQKQADALQAENNRLNAELEKASSELVLSKQLLSHTDQPHAYLVAQMERREQEISSLRQQLAKVNQSTLTSLRNKTCSSAKTRNSATT